MATPQAAVGTQIWIGDGGSPETYFQVPRNKDTSGPSMKADTIDVTTHDSLSGYKEFVTSFKDGGDVKFPVEFDAADVAHNESATIVGTRAGGLKYLLEQRVKRNMKLVLPTSPVPYRIRFVGVVTALEPDMKVMGSMLANVTIKVSGKPTLEPGQPPESAG